MSPTLAAQLAHTLADRGCRAAFGVTGAAIGRFSRALADAGIRVVHPRHEGGAAFMATEHALASGTPTVVFTTSGPGFSNAITGLVAAAWEGAHVVAVVGGTPPANAHRFPFQATGRDQLDLTAWVPRDVPFQVHEVVGAESLDALGTALDGRLAHAGGSLTVVLLPSDAQATPCLQRPPAAPAPTPGPRREDVDALVEALQGRRVLLWVGHGARHAASTVRTALEVLGAVVVLTPRAKGVVPESDPRCLGVLGLGGARGVAERVQHAAPDVALVLGARFSEFTSWWDARLVPPEGFVVVGLQEVGAAYRDAPVRSFEADPAALLRAALPRLGSTPFPPQPELAPEALESRWPDLVHPGALMAVVQERIVARDLPVISEAGNAFAWATRVLRFDAPRYRVSPDFGAMGQASAGVVGLALGTNGPAVALVGDGAMLMNTEISTAVATGARAIWVVLNDAAYGMIAHGMHAIGLEPVETDIPPVDFVTFARAQGADGARAHDAESLRLALDAALAADGPFVVDVAVDPAVPPPFGARNDALLEPQETEWRG
ncbi:MAG: thiamine pyrophosphate-binding protein [Myxococcota bacterium]